jgi:hypothetical protein
MVRLSVALRICLVCENHIGSAASRRALGPNDAEGPKARQDSASNGESDEVDLMPRCSLCMTFARCDSAAPRLIDALEWPW